MTYVTDTNPLVFFANRNVRRMSRRCAEIFARAEQDRDRIHIPVVCFFEIAVLLDRGRVRIPLGLDRWHEYIRQTPGFFIEPLVWEDVNEARGLAALPDPFDRLIAGTALRLDAPLITADAKIQDSGLLRTVW